MRVLLFISSLAFITGSSYSQKGITAKGKVPRPKLVVGIVIDQMRWDYLYRFAERYSNNGFKRLMKDGYSCDNTFIPYTPTYTAAGHSCVYTGSVPAINGIIGNFWYSRQLKRNWYCTDDTTVVSVGSSSDAGKMSPANMWSTSITDELRLATNFKSKVVGIALKDRGAILPAGHSANAAYWFDNANGAFISSTYYMKELPLWLNEFNNKKFPDQYLQQDWNTLHPIETYKESTADNKAYEAVLPGEDNAFPHVLKDIAKDKYNTLRHTPAGNTLTFDMAKAAIEGEGLGQQANTDFLALSFSSPDYIGHTFGPNSIEVEDCYLRLDQELASFLDYLDQKIGKGQYLTFLTSDHAAAHVPAFMKENKIPAGALTDAKIETDLNETIEKRLGIKKAVESIINYQVYLNNKLSAMDKQSVKLAVKDRLLELPAVANVVDLENIANASITEVQKGMIVNGYNQKLSGDIQFIFKPGWFDGWDKGTTHGSWTPYDSHIPLLWYGWGINKGSTNRETYMTDIAATLAALLHIQMPNGSIGKVITEVVK